MSFHKDTLTELLAEAKGRALQSRQNIAVTIDGALLETDQHRPHRIPERLAILQYYQHLNGGDPGVVMCTHSDTVREAWRPVRAGTANAI